MWSDSDKIGTSDLVLSSSLDCSALERAELSLKRCRFFLLCPLAWGKKCASVQVGLEEALEPSSGSKATELRGRRVSATTAGRATIILDSRRGTRHT